jgi:hypothetical protein
VRWGDGALATGRPDAPWGPLEKAWPPFGDAVLPDVIAVVVAIGVAAAFFVDPRVWRRLLRRERAASAA